MKRYEYRRVSGRKEGGYMDETELNEWGKKGWLVIREHFHIYFSYLMAREIK